MEPATGLKPPTKQRVPHKKTRSGDSPQPSVGNYKLSWSNSASVPRVVEYQSIDHLLSNISVDDHQAFWNHAVSLLPVHDPNVRRWKITQNQLHFIGYWDQIIASSFFGAVILSTSLVVLFCEGIDPSKFAEWVASAIVKNNVSFVERVEVFGSHDYVRAFLTRAKQDNNTNYVLAPHTNPFKKTVANAQRVFFIPQDRLNDKTKTRRPRPNRLLEGRMRLAEIEDIMQVRQIFHANDEKDDEEDGGDVPTNEDDNLDDLVAKDKIWVWERERSASSGKILNRDQLWKTMCFAILEYHDRREVSESSIELIDIHMLDAETCQPFASALIDGLAEHYLKPTEKRSAYKLLHVAVDSDMPESSDEFLTSCGFKLDGAFDSVSLVSLAEHKEKQKETKKYLFTGTVKVASATESAFMAYTILDTTTCNTKAKRYRDFDKLYDKIKHALPKVNLPKPPKKKLFGNLDSSFIERRRAKLERWLNELASIPEVADTYLVDDFMCTEMKRRGAKELTDQDKLEQALRRANTKGSIQIVKTTSRDEHHLVPPQPASSDDISLAQAYSAPPGKIFIPTNLTPIEEVDKRLQSEIASPAGILASPRKKTKATIKKPKLKKSASSKPSTSSGFKSPRKSGADGEEKTTPRKKTPRDVSQPSSPRLLPKSNSTGPPNTNKRNSAD